MGFQNTSPDYSADGTEESTAAEDHGSLASAVSYEAVGFWLAVTLPVPTILLLASGVSTVSELAAISGLLASNLLAFYVGHEYSTDSH